MNLRLTADGVELTQLRPITTATEKDQTASVSDTLLHWHWEDKNHFKKRAGNTLLGTGKALVTIAEPVHL
eukprot:scaffold6474_cov23-Cyclotella_meneghiniana.AAC.10